jgi:hypothetical protein
MEGSATFTMLTSSNAMNAAIKLTVSARHRRGSDSSSSWTTLTMGVPSPTNAPTPVLIKSKGLSDHPREGALLRVTAPRAIHRF